MTDSIHHRLVPRAARWSLALVVAVLSISALPAGAGEATDSDADAADGAPEVDRHTAEVIIADDPRVEADLGAVLLDSPEYRKAVAAYLETEERLANDEQIIASSIVALRQLAAADDRLSDELVTSQRRRLKSERRLVEIRSDLKDLAVSQYVRAGMEDPLFSPPDVEDFNEASSRRVFADTVQAERRAELHFQIRHRDQQLEIERASHLELTEVRRRVGETSQQRDRATADRDAATVALVEDRARVADTRLMADVAELDFRFVNFNAYYRAALAMRATQPDCGIRWTAIAAIARTESWHGTYGGSEVDADGDLTKPIYGIALDGTNGTASIGDTDGGELDGDPNTDRAVGPMQFIPSTWKAVERDGNDDGEADPQNLYDATVTAAAYLCRQGPGLDLDAGLRRAFRSYNNDGSYVELVLSRAHAYDAYEVPPLGPGQSSPSPAIIHEPPEEPPEPATTTSTTDKDPSTPPGSDPRGR